MSYGGGSRGVRGVHAPGDRERSEPGGGHRPVDRPAGPGPLQPAALTGSDRGSRPGGAGGLLNIADFSDTVAVGEVARAREALLRLAKTVGETVPQEAVCARFGDDEICAILPETGVEDAYQLAEEVLRRLAEGGPEDLLLVDAGVAGYPVHGGDAGEVVTAAMGALNTAKRVGGSGIVVAH